jgi:hypothetical protein
MLKGELVVHRLGGKLPGPKQVVDVELQSLPRIRELRSKYSREIFSMVHAHEQFVRTLTVSPRDAAPLERLVAIGRQARWKAAPDPRRLAEISGQNLASQIIAKRSAQPQVETDNEATTLGHTGPAPARKP